MAPRLVRLPCTYTGAIAPRPLCLVTMYSLFTGLPLRGLLGNSEQAASCFYSNRIGACSNALGPVRISSGIARVVSVPASGDLGATTPSDIPVHPRSLPLPSLYLPRPAVNLRRKRRSAGGLLIDHGCIRMGKTYREPALARLQTVGLHNSFIHGSQITGRHFAELTQTVHEHLHRLKAILPTADIAFFLSPGGRCVCHYCY